MSDERLPEIVEYARQQLARRDPGAPPVTINYHAAPPVAPAPPASPSLLDKWAPYFLLALGGCVILAIVAVIAIMLAASIAMIMQALMIGAVSVAVCVVAVVGAVRALREAPRPPKK